MREPLDRFCDDVRCRLTRIERRIAELKEKLSRGPQTTEAMIERDIAEAEAIRRRGADDAAAARARMRAYVGTRVVSESRMAERTRDQDLLRLERHVEDAEAFAAWALIAASEAIDDVELATLTAIAERINFEKRSTK